MGRHSRTRTPRSGRWAAIAAGTVAALVAALAPPAHADPFDPFEVWVNVSSEATFDSLEGASVTLYDDAGAQLETAETDASGDAGFTALDPGTYYVSAVADGHVEQFYDGSPDLDGAWPLSVDEFSGDVAWMSLAAEPQIRGTVTGPGDNPLELADVTVWQYDEDSEFWDWISSTSTDESGDYELGGLEDGTYRLGFSADGFVEEFFDDHADVETADDVAVAMGGPVVVASAQLEPAKHITGTVTDGTDPLADVQVVAEQEVEEFGDVFWEDVSFATTDADGTYSLDVDPGEYRVRFESDAHLTEWWEDAHVAADADLVPVTTGDVPDVDAALDEGGSITGTVRAFGGTPLDDIWVSAYRWNDEEEFWEDVASESSTATGAYSIDNLMGGTYRVGFEDFDDEFLTEYYANADDVEAGTDVPVTIGSTTTGIDATLDKAGIIEGTVTGPGLTQANLDVSLWERERFAKSGWSRTFAFATKSGNTYRFTGLEPGTYRVRAAAPGLAPEFYLDDYEVALADDVVAAKNTTTTADLALATAPTISGTVTTVGGAVLAGATVLVQRKTTGTDGRFWDDYATTTTDASGNYTTTVPPGTYRVRFTHTDHAAEWHDGSATPSRSTQLQVSSANLDVDAALDRLGRITGTVTGPSGVVNGATVSVWRYDNTFGDGAFRQVRTAATNASGTYSVTGLQPGHYRVGVRAAGLQGEFYPDAQDVEYAGDVAVELNQTRGGTSVVLAAPVRQLSGIVTGTTQTGTTPLEGADVVVSRRVVRLDDVVTWREIADVQTDATGAWSLPVAPGDYRVYFTDGGWVDEYYDDAATEQEAEVVDVTDDNRPGINAQLAPGGRITGTVTDVTTDAPLADAEVYAFMPNGDDDEFAFVGADGSFSLDGLSPGEWVVQYEADGYIGEYYDDKPTQASADRILVTSGGSETADAELAAATEVSGTVTGSGGAPLDFAGVDIHRVLGPGEVDYFFESAFTGPDGTWSALLPPGTYLVEFNADGDHLAQWYDGKPSEATATPVVVGATSVTGVDAQLQLGGVIAGTVTGPGGDSEPDAYVSVYPASATSEFDSVWEGFVDADGRYRSEALPAGSYKVRFETFDGTRLAEYHQDKATLAAANAVAVTLGGTTTVDAQLAAYPRLISGTVTDAQARGLDGVEVSLYRDAGGGAWTWERDVATDADGHYDLPVSAGEYRLSFTEPDNRLFEWWDDAKSLSTATSVTVAGVDRTGIDAQLADGGVVTGTVTYPTQVTGWSSTVTLYDAATDAWAGQARVDAHQNRYRIEDLPTGSYRAEFSRTGGFDTAEAQFWNGRPEHQGKGTQTFAVTQGSTTPDIGTTLVEGGILTGIVQNGQGDPLEGCKVSAFTLDGSLVLRESRRTRPDGRFRVRGLTTGSYRLRVFDGECGFTTLFYDGVGSLTTNSSNAVGVTATRGASGAVPQPLVVPTSGVIENTELPTVSDTTPEVGQMLTAGTGSWSQTGLDYAYQWLADGVAIPGATGASYVVGADQVGKAISVRVTASKADFADGIATSAATADVVSADPPITNNAPPAISDTTPEVGQALTSTNGSWSQTGLTFARQWTADGVDIPGATSQSYTVQASDEGKVLRVRVTVSKTGFASGTATSAPTSAVVKPSITNTGLPTISDPTPEVGQALTSTDGTWSQTGLTFVRQWTADGVDIPGATAAGYTVQASDEGKVLRVRVTASKAGFNPATAASVATSAVVKPSITNTGLPTISDTTPEVGQLLTAGDGTWSQPGLSFTYQWLRGTTEIPGAVDKTYTTGTADLGQRLRVEVTVTKNGFKPGVAESAQTEPVVDPTAVVMNTVLPSITGVAAVGQVLTAQDGTWTPDGVTLSRQWMRNGVAIPGQTGPAYTLVAADLGKAITVTVTGTKSGYVSPAPVTSQPTAAVAAGTITATRPKITGKAKVGKTLTAKIGTSTPSAVKVKYQWLRNGKAIKKATKPKYKLTKKDKGKKISVKVTRTATGYQKLAMTSAQTKAVKR